MLNCNNASIVTVHQEKSASLIATVGNWVEVDYNGEFFPGEIKSVDDYLVSVMVCDGKYWKWPSQVDEIFYPQELIIRKLNPPNVVNARDNFKFN